jgi:hypothetical protein
MIKIALFLSGTLIFIGLSGCTAMSVEECHTANWGQVGERDGELGRSPRLASYYKACQKANLVPDQRAYEQGYKQGLEYYCQPEVIFRKSLVGQGGYMVCPASQRSLLRSYHEIPTAYYEAKLKRERLNKDLDYYTDRAKDKKITQEKRDEAAKKARALDKELRDAERAFQRAEWDLKRLSRESGF